MEKRYAVAYKSYPDDPAVFHNGHPICIFGQDEGVKEMLEKYWEVCIPQKETPYDTYRALEKELSKKIGKPVELVFTDYQPTIWRIKGEN